MALLNMPSIVLRAADAEPTHLRHGEIIAGTRIFRFSGGPLHLSSVFGRIGREASIFELRE